MQKSYCSLLKRLFTNETKTLLNVNLLCAKYVRRGIHITNEYIEYINFLTGITY